ncbi:MAG: hypothetical protein ACUVQG_10040 [Thermogutta sp.]
MRKESTLLAMRGDDRAELYECSAEVAELNGGVGHDKLYLSGNRIRVLKLYGWE